MRKRTLSREYALQLLYQIDIHRARDSYREICNNFWLNCEQNPEKDVREFAQNLIDGTIANIDMIDQMITKYADNWQIHRMAVVDRNILRMSIFELVVSKETPPKVVINEAVDIAKKYGDVDSGKFVNGILDSINKAKDK